MLNKEEKERYNRHLILSGFGEEAQLKLKAAKVLVIGAGGLGCPVLQYLNAAGVGALGIIDNDVVGISNLQRQILFSVNDIGKPKVKVAKEKLEQQNPHTTIICYNERLNKNNALSIFSEYDIIVDGSDNFGTKYLVNDACVVLNKPLVYGAIHKFEGQVSVFNYKGSATYRCLYPHPPAAGEMPSCNEAGVIGILPGFIGLLQANEVLKIISDLGESLAGKLLCVNLLNNTQNIFELEAEIKNTQLKELGEYDVEATCTAGIINLETLNKIRNNVQLIDVREKEEYAARNMQGINIPLSELEERLEEVNPDKITVVHCKSGMRAKNAISIITMRYPGMNISCFEGDW